MLPVEKKPSYLSPSSLKMFEHEPNKFYLTRMAPNPMPREPQSMAAAVGSAFDVMIKNYLLNSRKCMHQGAPTKEEVHKRVLSGVKADLDRISELPFMDAFFELSVEPHCREEAKGAGLKIAKFYVEQLPKFDLTFMNLEIHREFTLFNQGVPLFMKLDSSVLDKSKEIPFDWKVKGYSSDASPVAGYAMIVGEDGVMKGAHEKFGLPMDQINEDWAMQLATYGWGLGKIPGEPFMAMIHSPVLRSTGMRIALYYAEITAEFQKKLIERYREAWHSIQSGKFVRSLGPDRGICEIAASTERWF